MSGHRHFTPDVQATGFEAKPAAGSALVVGQIEIVVGVCSLTRPGGDPFQVKRGDPICRGDILETTAGGKVGIRFIDGTAFNLSDSARAVVKEFGCDGAEPSALFDISRGTFAFIAGEVAKLGRLGIETPFASIRGRAQSGGIGMLSLASLFFAALDNAHGTTTPPGLEDGIINLRDSNDIINAPFGIIELTVGGQTIFIDTPLAEFVVRGTSVSQVPLSLTQLQQYIIESINVQNIAGVGQPTVGGPSGSGGLPPPGPPPFVEPINFVPPPVPPSGGPTGGTNSSGTGVDIFIPPPPPPPPPLGPGEIREIINVTNSGTIDSTDGPLPVGGPYELTSLTWSGGDLSDAQRDSLKQGTFTPSGSTYTYTIADHLLDFVAGNETVKITYTSTVDPTQSVTITVFGTNDRPVITSVAQSATLAEASETAAQNPSLNAGDLTTNGTLNFTDIDITDANHSPHVTVAQSGTTNAALTDPIALSLFSTIVTNTTTAADGTIAWTFDGSEALFDYLNNGEHLTLTYTVTVSDEALTSNQQTVTITINGANDAPVITSVAQSATLAEASETAAQNPSLNAGDLTTNGTLNFTDIDITDANHSPHVTVAQSGTTNAALTDPIALSLFSTIVTNTTTAADGTIAWTFDGSEALFDYLNNGEHLTLTYTVTVSDEALTSNQQTVTITINGANDAPVITSVAQSATLAEASETAAQNPSLNAGDLTTNGTLNFTDIDITDANHSPHVTVAQSGTTNAALTDPIALSLFSTIVTNTTTAADGTIAWTFDGSEALFDYLNNGEHLTLTYTVTVSDEALTSNQQTVTITINGANDAPVITSVAQSATLAEASETAAQNPSLNAGDLTTNGTLNFTDIDITDANHSPHVTVAQSGTTNAALTDPIALSLFSTIVTNTTTAADGTIAWTFDGSEALFDYLNNGEHLTLTYTVTVSDEALTSNQQTVTITINGANDAPVITSVAQSATLAEASETAAQNPSLNAGDLTTNGTLNFTDIDITDANHSPHVTVAQSGTTNAALTDPIALSLFSTIVTNTTTAADGTIAWTFDGSEALFDYLNNGEHLTLTYTVTVSDEALTSNQQTVTITINGANDAPVITSVAQSATLAEASETAAQNPSLNAGDLTTNGTLNFTDIDITDANHSPHVTVAQSGTTNAALTDPIALSLFSTIVTNTTTAADGTIAWTFDGSEALFDYLNNGEHLTLTYTVTVSDEALTSNQQTVTITINGANDAPVITSVAQSATLAEDGDLTTNGTLNFTDIDITDANHSPHVTVAQSGTTNAALTDPIALSLFSTIVTNTTTAADGTIAWTFDGSEALFDYLNEGQTLTLTYTITVSDEGLTSNLQTVTITIIGVNDADPNDFDDQATGTEVVTIGNIVHGTALGDPTIAGGGNTGQTIYGGGGNDHINGTGQNDIIFGGSGNDDINGNGGDDLIYGGSGNDTINGSNDNDIIIGGFGADSLTGGGGDDAFHYLSPLDSNAAHFDTITDFLHGNDDDLIDLTAFGLAPTSGHEFHTNGTAAGVQNTDSANFFSISGTTYAVVSTQVGSDTYVYADLNQNGNFDTSGDLVIKLSGFTQTNLSSNDFLFTNSPANLINSVNGGEILAGTVGNDTFVFNAIANSQPGAGNFDTIINFMHNSDHIDLQAINGANLVQGQVNTATTVDAHSISWFLDTATNETIIYVNTTDTANHVDMEIHLTGTNINLSGSDILHT